jgi:hypothetical protein
MNSLSTSTFYNPFPVGSAKSQEHWANFINDATLAKYQVDAVGSFVERASREQIQAILRWGLSSSRTRGRIPTFPMMH